MTTDSSDRTKNRPTPTSSRVPTSSIENAGNERDAGLSVFVIGPIGTEGTAPHERGKILLEHVIKQALPSPKFNVRRADDEIVSDLITPRVIQRIHEARFVVADMTDQNANAFYELAVAHGYQKDVIYLCEANQTIPFDLKDARTIFYNLTHLPSVAAVISRISEAAEEILGESRVPHNPLTGAASFFDLKSTSQPTQDRSDVVADLLFAIESRLTGLEQQFQRRNYSINESAHRQALETPSTEARFLNNDRSIYREIAAAADSYQEASREIDKISDTLDSLITVKNSSPLKVSELEKSITMLRNRKNGLRHFMMEKYSQIEDASSRGAAENRMRVLDM